MRDANYTETIEFLSAFFRDTSEAVELRALPNGSGVPKVEFTRNPLRVIAFCQHYDKLGWGVYFGVATRDEAGRGGGREYCRELPALWAEIDIHKFGMSVEQAVAILLACPLPPSLIVSSGRGLHVYWLLSPPLSVTYAPFGEDAEKTRVELVTRSFVRIFHGDQNAVDLTRILRLPGTHNTREGDLKPCRVLEASWARYELEQVEAFAALSPILIAAEDAPAAEPAADPPPDDPYAAYGTNWREPFDLGRLDRMIWKDPDFPIHENRLRAIAKLVEQGTPDEEIFARALAATERAVAEAPPTPETLRERARWNWKAEEATIWREIRGAHALPPLSSKVAPEVELPAGVVVPFETRAGLRPGQQEQPDDDPLPPRTAGRGRPTIPVRAGHLSEIADQAERLFLDLGAPVYRRTSRLMRPVVEEDHAADGLKTKVARLVDVSQVFVVDYLGRLANWIKYDARSKKWVACDPPKAVAETILGREGEWIAPPVAGVITTPTLRPDGSILSVEGYDAATRLILLSPPELPIIPPQPTRADAQAALALLEELLTEFCFVDEPSRSVALSALITPVIRGALPIVPAHVMRAPVAGSGKSYLVDIASVISTGQRCPVISSGKDEMEQEKRIGAVLMGGQPIVSIDNLNGELRGDALCQMVERPIVQVRILGKSELMRIETRATLFATGNNIVVVGDMVRRTLLASMDANVERPELREFKQHPIEMVLADRGKYIAAVLTIVRAYQQAGYPNSLPTLASYNQWSLMVRSALVWLDRADPAETIEISRANDPELVSLNAVVTAWRIAVNVGETKTAGELVKLADAQENVPIKDENGNEVKDELGVVVTEFTYKHPDLRDALDMVARGRRGLDATLLGKWLSGQQNKVVGAVKIIKLGGGTHVRRWGLSTAI